MRSTPLAPFCASPKTLPTPRMRRSDFAVRARGPLCRMPKRCVASSLSCVASSLSRGRRPSDLAHARGKRHRLPQRGRRLHDYADAVFQEGGGDEHVHLAEVKVDDAPLELEILRGAGGGEAGRQARRGERCEENRGGELAREQRRRRELARRGVSGTRAGSERRAVRRAERHARALVTQSS